MEEVGESSVEKALVSNHAFFSSSVVILRCPESEQIVKSYMGFSTLIVFSGCHSIKERGRRTFDLK